MKQHRSWMQYGGSPDQSKFVVQDQITKSNVGQLKVAWRYNTGDQRSYQNNPVIIDRIMYVLAKENSLVALDAVTGEELWRHAELNDITRRGFSYWENEDRSDRRLLFTLGNSLQAINAITGESILTFGTDGAVDLKVGLGRDPKTIRRIAPRTPGRVFEDLIILGSFPGESYFSPPGHIRAYNVITGELAWIFHTIPQPGEYGYDTWPKDAYKYVGAANCWGEISVDVERGIAYIPLGSATYDYYGADRLGSNLFANCLVALDARTGERLWHFQTVHHDIWDYDLTSAPQLIRVKKDGERIDAVAIATKTGFLFAFNRETGEPIWPIEERPVPPSTMPGEEAWPTQPFPALLPAYNRQTVNKDDISDIFLSDEEYENWKLRVSKAKNGLFTPPDTSEVIAMPGAVGGTNWGNSASNPNQGIMYIMTSEYPSFYKLNIVDPDEDRNARPRNAQELAINQGEISYKAYCQLCHGEDLTGSASAPALLGALNQLTEASLRQIILNGVGRMPPVVHINEEEINNILLFLKAKDTGSSDKDEEEEVTESDQGPVVAVGGAPGGKEIELLEESSIRVNDYPEGVEAPAERYHTSYGLDHPYILNPPWTTISAYDLNKGNVIWKRPHGEDSAAFAITGLKNTGVPAGSLHNGMVVTSNGILFATVRNGTIYAYDADNGDILWKSETPGGIGSIPAMYEVDGKMYLVVNATGRKGKGWNVQRTENGIPQRRPESIREYVVFALP